MVTLQEMKKSLKKFYSEDVVPKLVKDFGYSNIETVPKILKISINRGLDKNSRSETSKSLEKSIKELATISGQMPTINKARASIAGFNVRQGMVVGTSVTIRRSKMYDFLDRIIHIVLPRVRDFRGLSPNGFGGSGNYSIGIRDQLCFPEILYDEIDQLNGFDICIVTTARNDTEGYALLKSLGLPLLALD